MNTPSSGCRSDTATVPIQDAARPVRRILAVDDDRDIRQLYADALISSGYKVDTAEDGVAGWQALRANSYDLLLTDNNMPKLSGVEFIRKLRSARMDLPVVLATTAIPTEEIGRNPSLELAATLLKPFSITELFDTVDKVLRAADSARTWMSVPVLAAGAHPLTPQSQWGISE
jgi:two-component system chemotaxis response regulator CheY